MKRIKHLTARYIYDRLAQMAYQRRNPAAPWIAADMVRILEQWLRPTDRGVEWGTGRSTIWLARRVAHLHAIEENADWYETVGSLLDRCGLRDKVDLRLLPLTDDRSGSAAYVAIAEDLAGASLDFALVDGDLRDHCAAVAMRLLKSGGVLIIDNVEHYLPRRVPTRSPGSRSMSNGYATPLWGQIGGELSSWRSIWTTDGVSDTALWVKP